MEKHHKFSIWYVLIGIWIVLIVHDYMSAFMAVQTIPYSQFLSLLNENKIKEVAISDKQIHGLGFLDEAHPEKQVRFKTVKVDPETSKLLEDHNVKFKGEIESAFFSTIFSWIIPILFWVGIWLFIMKRMAGARPGFMTLGKNKAKIYMEDELDVTFDDVAGVDEAKQELVEIIDFLRDPSKYTSVGGKIPKGILLVGPPGTGKTLLTKALAGESKVPFFSLSGSEFVEMFVGMGAARVRDLFVQAKEKAPCIIFIDELDALGKARGFGAMGGHDEREQTLNQLLVEMDGFKENMGVILVAATNRPEILDPALLRAGRFDRQILVDRPDKEGRKKILEVHLKPIKNLKDIDTEKIANMTPGMVGADLANLVNEATLLAIRKGKQMVEMAEFEEAVERVIAGLEKKNRLINPKEREIVAYHELGHALVAQSLPGTDPVQKISIIPRGIAALGYTLQVPTEDRFLMKKTELLNRIATLLGGRAAEELILGDISTGAHNDLSKATDIASSMVKQYGMSEKIGQVYFYRDKQNRFLDAQPHGVCEYSETTAQLIDQEIRDIIKTQYHVASDILREKENILKKASVLLLEKETITGEELKAITHNNEA